MANTTIPRATWTDDDGSGTTGTIINNARLQGDVYDKVDAIFAAAGGLAIAGPLVERGRGAPIGEWLTIPYSAGIFTASGSMTWTVSVAPSTLAYTVIGRTVILFFNIGGTIGGTASTDLFVTLPFNPTISTPGLCRIAGASAVIGLSYFLVGQSKMGIQPNAGGNHALGASNVQGTAFCQL